MTTASTHLSAIAQFAFRPIPALLIFVVLWGVFLLAPDTYIAFGLLFLLVSTGSAGALVGRLREAPATHDAPATPVPAAR